MESLAKLTKILFIKEIMKKNPIENNGKESNNEKLSQYS